MARDLEENPIRRPLVVKGHSSKCDSKIKQLYNGNKKMKVSVGSISGRSSRVWWGAGKIMENSIIFDKKKVIGNLPKNKITAVSRNRI